MQALTDRVPGAVGTTLRLNVSPSDAKTVKGFVAEGEIVRVLEDGRGFHSASRSCRKTPAGP